MVVQDLVQSISCALKANLHNLAPLVTRLFFFSCSSTLQNFFNSLLVISDIVGFLSHVQKDTQWSKILWIKYAVTSITIFHFLFFFHLLWQANPCNL